MAIEILVNYFYRKNIFFHCELQLLDKIGPLRYFSTPQGKIQSAGPGGGYGGLTDLKRIGLNLKYVYTNNHNNHVHNT